MYYIITNNGNSRDVFVKGMKYYLAKGDIIKTKNHRFMHAASLLPYIKIEKVKEK